LKPTNFDDGLDIYERQVKRFIAICRAAGVDAVVSTHPGFDGTEYNVEKIKARKQGDPNPWVMGTAGVARFWKLDQEMSAALHSLIVAAGKQ
jgi:metallo-beta-lactamase class B